MKPVDLGMSQRFSRKFWLSVFLGVAFPLSVFALLATLVAVNPDALPWDTSLMLALHPFANPQMDRVAAIASQFGTTWGVIPVTLLLIAVAAWKARWRIAIYLGLTLIGSSLLNNALKTLWHRARPALWEVAKPHLDFSFPSGHAMSSMTFVATLILLNWNKPLNPFLLVYGGLFVVIIGWTRLYLGVHFPSDILAGWMVSIALAVSTALLVFKPAQEAETAISDEQ
ncbi:MAG TPA: phosphatase PAP2 family protein [Trichocoleus sp.]